MWDEIRRAALVTSGIAELTRNRAEQVVRDLVKAGDIRRDQTSSAVKELLKRSAENRRELTRLIRSEIQGQVEGMGLASRRDLERLERRITRLEARAKEASATGRDKKKASGTTRKTTARRSDAGSAPKKEGGGS